MSIRFWIYHNHGPVKLSLRDHECMTIEYDRSDEESQDYYQTHLYADGETVFMETRRTTIDCDGRVVQQSTLEASVKDLFNHQDNSDSSIRYPKWRECSACVVDDYAIAAGY